MPACSLGTEETSVVTREGMAKETPNPKIEQADRGQRVVGGAVAADEGQLDERAQRHQ